MNSSGSFPGINLSLLWHSGSTSQHLPSCLQFLKSEFNGAGKVAADREYYFRFRRNVQFLCKFKQNFNENLHFLQISIKSFNQFQCVILEASAAVYFPVNSVPADELQNFTFFCPLIRTQHGLGFSRYNQSDTVWQI